jgi:hypothetical protein
MIALFFKKSVLGLTFIGQMIKNNKRSIYGKNLSIQRKKSHS